VELDGQGEGVRDEDVIDDEVEHLRVEGINRDGVWFDSKPIIKYTRWATVH
jgi:hypothetical protein